MIPTGGIHMLLPEIILGLAAIVVMLSIAVKRCHLFTHIFSLVAFVIAFLSLFLIHANGTQDTTLFIIDGYSRFFTGLIIAAAFFITVISYPYFKTRDIIKEEYYVLLILATLGAISMVISNHFISFFLSLEVMSISMYSLIAYLKDDSIGIEAGIKYLVMAAVSAAILLFGFALIYAATGQMELSKLQAMVTGDTAKNVLFIAGVALVIAGIGFKMALVPFHLWTPDIYGGAPAPVSAFVATISKGSVFAFLLRFFHDLNGSAHNSVWIAFAVIAIVSMLIGNLLALRQQNIKRILAYSSIGHLGYLMVALLAASVVGIKAAVFYLVTYFISMLSAFGIVSYLSGKDKELFDLEDYRGLFWQRPWLAALFTLVLISLAGIPLTAGFMGKFYLLLSGVGSSLWILVIVLIVSSFIGLFYYLRVAFTMFMHSEMPKQKIKGGSLLPAGIVLAIMFIFLLWIGVFPGTLLDIIQHLIPGI
ncbi:MAG: NADH-quinone oxidoreductase subunit N [Chitinophagaceae bacterium]